MKYLPKSVLDQAYDYQAYRQLIDDLFAQQKTTGTDHSESMLKYTKLNLARMNRLDRKSRLTEATISRLQSINRSLTWLVITEGWCGDAAQIVPVLHHMALESDHITLRFILRDQNLNIMDAFLTNNARSIPKVIVLDSETLEVLGSWGPRPAEVQQMVMDAKAAGLKTEDLALRKQISVNAAEQLHLWYARDKTKAIQTEFLAVANG
ncbi:MAG: thioredoxin family protein [Bacteroidota bacterium]